MEEKIIEARFKKNPLSWIVIAVGVIAIYATFIIANNDYLHGNGYTYKLFYGVVLEPNTEIYDNFFEYFVHDAIPFEYSYMYLFYAGILCILSGLFLIWLMDACAMTITSNRVIGKASFGKRVDLPISQISAVALGGFNRITVATSSGKLHFWLLKNRAEVHESLSKIIGKVQIEAAYKQNVNTSASNAEEMKKYKDLLDMGVITQEEFDTKKKQLLDL